MVLTPQERVFASEVERARGAAKVNQEWLGRRIRMSRSKVSEICNGRYLPTHDTVLLLVEALAMDRERTFALWRAARAARDVRRDDERTARSAPPVSTWDRLPVLPPEIVSLLRAHTLAAEDLPYRLPGAKRPSLSAVYVRQDLGQTADEALTEPRADHGFGPRRGDSGDSLDHRVGSSPEYVAHQLTAGSRGVRPPARAVRVALDGDQHLLITGGPGQGKSTLTLRLAADVSGVWLNTRGAADAPLVEPVVPLRLPARDLAAHLDMPFPEALAKSVAAEFGSLLKAEVPPHMLAGRVLGCRWLLLIDAIDEIVDREQQERLLRTLSHLATDTSDPTYRILVTSRPLGGAGLGILHRAGVARYELQPFDAEALRAFADHWFTADGAPDGETQSRRFLTQVKEAHLSELTRVPLLATIAAIISEQRRDRPLPDNRHDLYETYLDYIARRGVSSHRRYNDGVFQEVRTRLLEHLGVVRLATTGSLAKAACDWLTEQMPVDRLPVDWQSELMTFLATAGPMIVRRDDLEFLHHSFADHLAATARARELPAMFNAEQDVWREILHSANSGHAHAEAVLLHYGHLHPNQADEMARWLCGNTAGFQLVAARLLAKHFPASAETIDSFLEKVRSWALMTVGLGAAILREVSKATHHRPLPSWLRALMDEPEVPQDSRIKAAVTLCTLFDSAENSEALSLLHAVMRDPTSEISHRLIAAQGLSEVGAQQRAQAADGLRAVLADPAVGADARRTAAVVLADLGGEARDLAVDVLLEALLDPTTSVEGVRLAAVGLAEIGPEFEDRAASVLSEIAGDGSCDARERRFAALDLGSLGPAYKENAATLLEQICGDSRLRVSDRSPAALALADLGPDYQSRAAGNLLHILSLATTEKSDMWWLVADIGELDPAFHGGAAAYLRGVLEDPVIHSNARLWTINALSKLGIAYHADVADEYRMLWADPYAGTYDRCQAMANLADLGLGYRDEAATLLDDAAAEPTAAAAVRVEAATMLARLDPLFHTRAGEILRELMVDDSIGDGLRIQAASELATLGLPFHPDISAVLKDVLSHRWSGSESSGSPYEWQNFGRYFRDESLTALWRMVRDPSSRTWARENAARFISQIDPERQSEVVAALCAVILEWSDQQQDLGTVIERLVAFGSKARDLAMAAIRTHLSDEDTDLVVRLDLAKALEALGADCCDEVAGELRFVLADPAAEFDLRVRTGAALVALGPRFHSEAASILGSLLEDPRRRGHWGTLASSFVELGWAQRDQAASPLRGVLADAALESDHQHAASALARIGPEFRDEAEAAMRRLISDHDQPAAVRVGAAWDLIGLLHSPQPVSTACLLEVSADPCQTLQERSRAMEYLVRSDRERRPQVVSDLRSALQARNVKPADVLTVTARLRELRAITDEEAYRVFTATADDPAATSWERREAITRSANCGHHLEQTRELLRTLLWDRIASAVYRIPRKPELADVAAPLAHEVDTVLNEVLVSAEYTVHDRLAALTAMEQLGGPHRKRAATVLREAIAGEAATGLPVFKALDALAGFGGKLRLEACDLADRMLTDDRRPLRERLAAAKISLKDVDLRPLAVELLLQVLRGRADPWFQVDAASQLLELGTTWRTEAVGELRHIAQDARISGFVRVEAAAHLAKWSPPDRITAAAVPETIACDPASAPALRWRAARSLADRHGPRFRSAALTHLQALAADQGVAASARVDAAEALAELDPRRLPTAVKTLRAVASDPGLRPGVRIRALSAIGGLGRGFVDEAVAGLRRLAHDSDMGLAVRGAAAVEMGLLRRDCREEAALTMREIVRSSGGAVHVRWRAARWLAILGPACRDEGLACLAAIRSEPW